MLLTSYYYFVSQIYVLNMYVRNKAILYAFVKKLYRLFIDIKSMS